MNQRITIENIIKEANISLNSQDAKNTIEIIEPALNKAQNQYYSTGLNNDRENLFICYTIYAVANEMLYNKNNSTTNLNIAIVYFNNAIRLKEEIKKIPNSELRQIYDLYNKVVVLNRISGQADVSEKIISSTKDAWKLYHKTKSIEDLVNYLGMLEYTADCYFEKKELKKAFFFYKKCIKLFIEANKIQHTKNSQNEVLRIYRKVIKLLNNDSKLKTKLVDKLKTIDPTYKEN